MLILSHKHKMRRTILGCFHGIVGKKYVSKSHILVKYNFSTLNGNFVWFETLEIHSILKNLCSKKNSIVSKIVCYIKCNPFKEYGVVISTSAVKSRSSTNKVLLTLYTSDMVANSLRIYNSVKKINN